AQAGFGRRYFKAFVSGFFVAVPMTVSVLDCLAYVARVDGASMQPSLNPEGGSSSDVVLLNRWSVRNYQVQRGDIVSILLIMPISPQVSLGLVHGRASHIIWPPRRWQRIVPSVPVDRRPLLNWDGETEDD
ncbi:mitochondrial inner membrane protease subunit 2, partial [Triplophysa rosa]